MTEPKATTAQEIVRNEKDCDYMDELFGGVKMPPTQVYLKSEADKVIADLKNEIEKQKQLRDMALSSVPNVLKVMKIIQHQKYKRCMAMAKLCKRKRIDAADYRIPRKKWEFYDKWYKRWLKIAEKFKGKEEK